MTDQEKAQLYDVLLQDSCADDTAIRAIIKAACPGVDVDGDSHGVPDIVAVVEMGVKDLQERIEEARGQEQ